MPDKFIANKSIEQYTKYKEGDEFKEPYEVAVAYEAMGHVRRVSEPTERQPTRTVTRATPRPRPSGGRVAAATTKNIKDAE